MKRLLFASIACQLAALASLLSPGEQPAVTLLFLIAGLVASAARDELERRPAR